MTAISAPAETEVAPPDEAAPLQLLDRVAPDYQD